MIIEPLINYDQLKRIQKLQFSLYKTTLLNPHKFCHSTPKTLKMSSSSSHIRTIPSGHFHGENYSSEWKACFDLINNTPTPQCAKWFDAVNENNKDIMMPEWTDGKEDDNVLVLKVKMPGVNKEDVGITVEKGVVTATGRIPVPGETKEDRRTKGSGGYLNRLMLRPPYVYKVNQIKAKMRNGVLKIVIPKDIKRTEEEYVDEFIRVKVI